MAAVLYGVQSGTFDRLGLTVKIQAMASGALSVAAVIGGTLHMAKASVVSLAVAHLRGLPLMIFAPSAVYVAGRKTGGILVAKDSKIKAAPDFAGKVAGVTSLVDAKVFSMRVWLDKDGGDSNAIKFVEIPGPSGLAALTAGRVDAIIASTPFLDDALASGSVRDLGDPLSGIGNRFVTAWYTTQKYATDNSDVVRRFRQGLYTSARYANSHPAQMAAILAPFAGLTSRISRKHACSSKRLKTRSTTKSLLTPPPNMASSINHSRRKTFC